MSLKKKTITFKTIGAMIKAFRLGQVGKNDTGRVIFEPPPKRKSK
jgi:hypothetical protein